MRSTTSNDTHTAKTLTPQRKHRKLLKDGTSEVWPEDIESIFVQGLRQYWDSPWATYSRGRSRWRNQFLVDYLHKAGVDRSKKQVASHIQVLRNMWKGEPEYHLVAGGEELFTENGLLTHVKSEEPCDKHLLSSEDTQSPSPSSNCNFLPHSKYLYPRHSQSVACMASSSVAKQLRSRSLSSSRLKRINPSHRPPSFPSSYQDLDSKPQLYLPSDKSPYQSGYCDVGLDVGYNYLFDLPDYISEPSSPEAEVIDVSVTPDSSMIFYDNHLPLVTPNPSIHSSSEPANGLARLTLWTEGMLPFTVEVGTLISSQQLFQPPSTAAIRIKLHLPAIDAPYSPTLHGFHGSIAFTAQSSSSARCSTSVFARNVCISRETDFCPVMTMEGSGQNSLESAVSYLPESSLSRSRWLDAFMPTCIVQKIQVDQGVLAVVVYDLDREICDSMPSAELTGISKYNGASEEKPQAVYAPSLPPPAQTIPRSCYPMQSSIPGNITPSFDSRMNIQSTMCSPFTGMTATTLYQ